MATITVQVGPYANAVGTHIWNTHTNYRDASDARGGSGTSTSFAPGSLMTKEREASYGQQFWYCSDVMFKENGLPRLVAVDAQGGFGNLSQNGNADPLARQFARDPSSRVRAAQEITGSWGGSTELFHMDDEFGLGDFGGSSGAQSFSQEMDSLYWHGVPKEEDPDTRPPGSKQKADAPARTVESGSATAPPYGLQDEVVEVWTDYLVARVGPMSLVTLAGVHATDPFSLYPMGVDATKAGDFLDEFEDRVRREAEACDRLSVLNVLGEVTGGWGGVTSTVIEMLSDDYSGRSIVLSGLACAPTISGSGTRIRSVTDMAGPALSMGSCVANVLPEVSLFLPFGAPLRGPANYVQSSAFQNSAMVAEAWDALFHQCTVDSSSYATGNPNHSWEDLTRSMLSCKVHNVTHVWRGSESPSSGDAVNREKLQALYNTAEGRTAAAADHRTKMGAPDAPKMAELVVPRMEMTSMGPNLHLCGVGRSAMTAPRDHRVAPYELITPGQARHRHAVVRCDVYDDPRNSGDKEVLPKLWGALDGMVGSGCQRPYVRSGILMRTGASWPAALVPEVGALGKALAEAAEATKAGDEATAAKASALAEGMIMTAHAVRSSGRTHTAPNARTSAAAMEVGSSVLGFLRSLDDSFAGVGRWGSALPEFANARGGVDALETASSFLKEVTQEYNEFDPLDDWSDSDWSDDDY